MTPEMIALSAMPATDSDGKPCALVQFASVSDGELETMPNLTPYPVEIEGEVCGQSIEEAVYKLLDRLNGKEPADGDE